MSKRKFPELIYYCPHTNRPLKTGIGTDSDSLRQSWSDQIRFKCRLAAWSTTSSCAMPMRSSQSERFPWTGVSSTSDVSYVNSRCRARVFG